MHLMWYAGVLGGTLSSGDYMPFSWLGAHIYKTFSLFDCTFFLPKSVNFISVNFVIGFKVLI